MSDLPSGPRRLWKELRRRGVVRVGVLYIPLALAVLEAADLLFPRLGLSDGAVQLVLGLLVVGYPLALGLAWMFERGPGGLRLDHGPDADAAGTPGGGAIPDTARPALARTDRQPSDRLLVLPFANIGPQGDGEYFSDGLTEEIIGSLTRIRSLRVISRTSAMRLKGTDKDVPTIGRELDVRYVLEGSVRKRGDDLRISAQLIDAATDEHLWADTYEGSTAEVFVIQERVAGAIAGALRIELGPLEARAIATCVVDDPVAHESYLRARHEMWTFSRAGLDKALRHIHNAIEIVGENELLLATLGHIHVWFLQVGAGADEGHLHEAERCADAIERLSPDSRHLNRLRGFIAFQRGDLRGARPHLRRSLEWNPDDPDALALLGYLHCLSGREDLAFPAFERLLAIDPLTPLNHAMPGFAAALQGRFADAVEPYRAFMRMDGGAFSLMNWVWVMGLNDRIEEAQPEVERLKELHGDTPFAAIGTGLFHAFRGESERALAALSPALVGAARESEMFARFLAQIRAMSGDAGGALEAIERAVEIGLANYPFLAHLDPLLDPVRGSPRFRSLLDRVEKEWRALQG